MTHLIISLRDTLQMTSQSQTRELQQYQVQLCDHVLRIKKNCEERLLTILQKWLQITFSTIIQAMNYPHAYTIRNNLQQISVEINNRQQTILDQFQILQTKFLTRNQATIQSGQLNGKRLQSQIAIINQLQSIPNRQLANDKTVSYIKGRSLSTGLAPRRSLSRISLFAECKKIAVNLKHADRGIATLVKKQGNQKIKKHKRREQNCFTLLQKTMSNTSPSCFMNNYMNKCQQIQKQQQHTSDFVNGQRKSYFANQKQLVDKNKLEVQMCQKQDVATIKCQQSKQSTSYEQLVLNLQQKISSKLDQLMSKYSKIQGQLKSPQLEKLNYKEQSKAQSQLLQDIAIKSQNIPAIQHLQKCQQIKLIELDCKKTAASLNAGLKSKGESQNKMTNNTKTSIKSIKAQNKIIRNKKIGDSREDSIQVIKLGKTSVNQVPQVNKNIQTLQQSGDKLAISSIQSKPKDSAKIQKRKATPTIPNRQYIQRSILQFQKVTGKLLLPISKKLLHSLKSKYQKVCIRYEAVPSQQIMRIDSEKMQDQQTQLKQLMLKMQKMLNLKCEIEKRQKIRLYINSFLVCWLSFDQNDQIIVHEEGQFSQQTTKQKLKEVVNRLHF